MTSAMKQRSLTRQAIGIVLAAQILCAALLCGATLLHEHHTRFRALDTAIRGRADSLLGAIQDAEDPDDNVAIAPVDPSELKLPAEDVYAVYNQGGRLIGSSPNAAKAPPDLIARNANGLRDMPGHRGAYRVLQRDATRIIDRAEYGGVGLRRPVTLVYAAPEDHVWHEIFEAARFYLIAVLLASVVAVLLVALLLRRALRPLSDLATAAGSIEAPDLTFDPPASALQVRELRPLTDVLAKSVARVRESFARVRESRAKEQRFFGDAAHELKTAIAVVRSSVQLLMMKPRTAPEYSAGLERVLEDNTRVESLVSQMLQLGRMESADPGDLPIIDLSKAVADIASRLRPIADQREITIRLDTLAQVPVRLAPEAAEMLVSNLLLNAIQHSAAYASISLQVRRKGAEGVCLEVADQGEGIGPEALPHIFERFYREDTSRSRETGGTGLGLAICKSIVDAAHGAIRVESQQGQGTTVEVTFPGA